MSLAEQTGLHGYWLLSRRDPYHLLRNTVHCMIIIISLLERIQYTDLGVSSTCSSSCSACCSGSGSCGSSGGRSSSAGGSSGIPVSLAATSDTSGI